MAKSKFQQAQEDYPMVASALNMFPPTRMAMGVGNVIDQASQDNASGVKDALLKIVPYGKTIGKAVNGDLSGAAQDIGGKAVKLSDGRTFTTEQDAAKALGVSISAISYAKRKSTKTCGLYVESL